MNISGKRDIDVGPTDVATQEPAAQQRREPDETMSHLCDLLDDQKLKDRSEIAELFSAIAVKFLDDDEEAPVSPGQALDAFSVLIEHQEFAALAEAYNAFNEGHVNPPVTEFLESYWSLRIDPPGNWQVANPEAMNAAFAKIQVQKLLVRPALNWQPGTLRPVPVDVSACVVRLLESGTSELTIRGALAEHDSVVDALAQSRLHSAELILDLGNDSVQTFELNCHNMLLLGLANCRTLQQLTFCHSFYRADALLAAFTRPGGAELTALFLTLKRLQFLSDEREVLEEEIVLSRKTLTTEIVETISKMPQLSALSLIIHSDEPGLMEEAVFRPLRGKAHLKDLRLDFQLEEEDEDDVAFDSAFSKQNVHLLTNIALFGASSPSLTHFTWSCNGEATDKPRLALKKFAAAGGFADNHMSEAVAAAFAEHAFNLRSITINGAILSKAELMWLFKALRSNRSVEHLNLNKSMIEATALIEMMTSLIANFNVTDVELPLFTSSCYYIQSADDRGDDRR
ncbi:hypothetical protein [Hydrogenophaga sp.]|uniref:hypothetical protein n=1 Tax=Hydrogenophaga sp. TaxID=1904254 RepID=UPI00271E6304|nr:hypothetical protein [Hydrogenophaga sp.]MDO9437164.1 hypothetical protein [Hydrogenophaga sp.]